MDGLLTGVGLAVLHQQSLTAGLMARASLQLGLLFESKVQNHGFLLAGVLEPKNRGHPGEVGQCQFAQSVVVREISGQCCALLDLQVANRPLPDYALCQNEPTDTANSRSAASKRASHALEFYVPHLL